MKWLVLISLLGAVISLGRLSTRVADVTMAMNAGNDPTVPGGEGDASGQPSLDGLIGMGGLRAQMRVGSLEELTKLSVSRASLLGIRVAITDFHGRTGRYPSTRELSIRGMVLTNGVPENHFNGSNRVRPVTREQAARRATFGGGHGWAYYDGSRGGTSVVYANSDVVGENGY